MCVHDTDSRGYCVKNGLHCAFAHGSHDHRPPVYDIKEIQALEAAESEGSGSSNGPNALDKERNLMNEDPKWQGRSFGNYLIGGNYHLRYDNFKAKKKQAITTTNIVLYT